MLNNPSRRSVLGGFAAAGIALTLPGATFALNDVQAKRLVDALVGDINKVIASGQSEGWMIGEFEKIFVRYGDVPMIARSALGADARGLSGAEMNAYVRAFQGYISRKYGKRFREFIGGRIEVLGAHQVKSFFEVKGMAHLKGQTPFELNFLVSDKSGKDKFFDMIIEGVSLRLTEKGEIGAMFDQGGRKVQNLIATLNKSG